MRGVSNIPQMNHLDRAELPPDLDQSLVDRDERNPLSLGQGEVKAIVNGVVQCQRDFAGASPKRGHRPRST